MEKSDEVVCMVSVVKLSIWILASTLSLSLRLSLSSLLPLFHVMTVPRKKYLIYDWTSQTLEREKMSIICSWRAHSFCLWTARQCNSERFMWCCWEEKNRLWNSYSCIDANLFQFNLFHLKKKTFSLLLRTSNSHTYTHYTHC